MRSLLAAAVLFAGCTTPDGSDAGRDAGLGDAPPSDDAGQDVGDGPAPDAPAAAGFRTEAALPHPLQEITAVAHGGRIVIAGGIDGSVAIVDEVWAFDGTAWTALPPLPAPRHHAMLVSVGTTLYLVGGMESLRFEPLDTVFALPDGATEWSTRPALPRPIAAAVGVTVGDEVVLAGGQTDRGLADAVLVGDPETGTWRDGEAIAEPREHVGGALVDGRVWVTGGRNITPATSVALVAGYDVDDDGWAPLPALSTVRGGHTVTVLDDRVLVAGGEIEDVALQSYEVRDTTGELIETGTLPTRRHGHGAAVLDGRVYLVGGADRPLFGATASVESWGAP